MQESKFPFVSRIEFIGSKLSNFSAHVRGVTVCISQLPMAADRVCLADRRLSNVTAAAGAGPVVGRVGERGGGGAPPASTGPGDRDKFDYVNELAAVTGWDACRPVSDAQPGQLPARAARGRS